MPFFFKYAGIKYTSWSGLCQNSLDITLKGEIKSRHTAYKAYYQVKVDDQIYYWGLFRLSNHTDCLEPFKSTPYWNSIQSSLIGSDNTRKIFVDGNPSPLGPLQSEAPKLFGG